MGFSMTTWATYLSPPLTVSFSFYPPFEPILPEPPDATDLEAGDLLFPGQPRDCERMEFQYLRYFVRSKRFHKGRTDCNRSNGSGEVLIAGSGVLWAQEDA